MGPQHNQHDQYAQTPTTGRGTYRRDVMKLVGAGTALGVVGGAGGVAVADEHESEDGDEDWEEFRGAVNERYTDGFFDGLAIDDETLYAGTLEDGLLAISTDSGDVRWVLERDLDGVSVSVVDDTLYAAWGNRLLAFR